MAFSSTPAAYVEAGIAYFAEADHLYAVQLEAANMPELSDGAVIEFVEGF